MTKELIYKYFNNTCSPEEYEMVNTYLKGNDITLFHEYMDEVASHSTNETTIDQEESLALLKVIHQKIETEEVIKHISKEIESDSDIIKINANQNPGAKRTFWSFPLRIAASIIVLFTIGGVYAVWKKQEDKATPTLAIWTTMGNPSINVKKLVMPDGTNIWLNAYSSLAYKKSEYNLVKREVRISGEAFFDVVHNVEKPFVVRSGNLSTTVLGTAFNVEAYKTAKDISIILVRGRVKVQAENQEKFLVPGQILKYGTDNRYMDVKSIETKDVNAWIDGKLVFNDIPLADAFKKMAQQYNITIIAPEAKKLNNKRLTGVFERQRPEDLLRKILFIYGFDYDKKGGKFIIKI
ncbi:DUF4974 domain-containing protein [Pedobacter polaris]|uniref:DUF4974 domain-containing protein n=1 Tax=Pedobacter polaris TaxID=2571273 RepID=A0A4U1CQS8_9SPHI|nr:FecR domain-containing protein [Pedobacter polaris]TKC08072.1 DUF4974 domain-containing protein [Pedobacter polaris]